MEWRDIENFPGYQVSDTGLVRSLNREVVGRDGVKYSHHGRNLKQDLNMDGYAIQSLWKNGKRLHYAVHSLVARAFIGACPEGMEICHGVGGRLDNSVENLSYGTRSSNQLDRYRDGVMNCKPVRRGDGVVFRSVMDAARASNTRSGIVSKVCNKIHEHAGGHTFEFI